MPPFGKRHRLAGYDYTTPGAYFVTICTHLRKLTLGSITDGGEISLSPAGAIAEATWPELPRHFPTLRSDEFVVMPNHVHGIIWLDNSDPAHARHALPLRPARRGPLPGSLAAVVAAFKAATTRQINQEAQSPVSPLWQRHYYDHIIRGDESLLLIRRYISENPLKWSLDPYNLARGSTPARAQISTTPPSSAAPAQISLRSSTPALPAPVRSA